MVFGLPRSVKGSGCQASKLVNSDACPRPTTPDLSCVYREEQLEKKQDTISIGEHGDATLGCPSCAQNNEQGVGARQIPVNIALSVAYTNPVSTKIAYSYKSLVLILSLVLL